ncbi:condensation domain-containing protein [Sphaerimonospora cavernae]|uniref:Condensation domain-containing protein n=1 Tax=Sphaerimonospora cavernae TaxID=1740611 RepID=A0ABV6U5Y3_9ACTN
MSVSEAPDVAYDISREEPQQIPLSWNQAFLCGFDRGDEEGPFGPRYTIVCGWRLTGALDVRVLGDALNDVVARHEALRTEIIRGDGSHQRVRPPTPARLVVRDLSGVAPEDRGQRAEELLNEVEAEPFPVAELPLVRATVARFDERDAVLVLVAHHTAADEWSMRLIMRDLVNRYAARRGHAMPDLPQTRQYREYVDWERAGVDPVELARSQAYWRENLRGARVLGIRADHPRSAGLPKGTAWRRFHLPADLVSAALRIGKETRCSLFMVLLAAYGTYLRDRARATDIVIPTFSSGRGRADFHDTVGSFFNFLPLRVDLAACATFREAVLRTRAACIGAYSHDIPFVQVVQEAPELMLPAMEDDIALIVFQVFKSPLGGEREIAGDLEYSVIRRRVLSQQAGADVPDGAMWHLEVDPTGEIIGSMAYNTNLFDDDTIGEMVREFGETLYRVVTAPDVSLGGD